MLFAGRCVPFSAASVVQVHIVFQAVLVVVFVVVWALCTGNIAAVLVCCTGQLSPSGQGSKLVLE